MEQDSGLQPLLPGIDFRLHLSHNRIISMDEGAFHEKWYQIRWMHHEHDLQMQWKIQEKIHSSAKTWTEWFCNEV